MNLPGAGIVAVGGSVVLMGVARRLALRLGFVARPNPIVTSHREPVAYLGGLALALAWSGCLALCVQLGWLPLTPTTVARSLGALALMAVGTCDDWRPLTPRAKLVAIALVSAWLVRATAPGGAASACWQWLWLVTLANAVNLIDVMDGALAMLALAGVAGLTLVPGLVAYEVRVEALALVPPLLGLWVYNRPPARIYAGDAGSLMVGLLLGAWSLPTAGRSAPPSAVMAGIAAVPLLELVLLVSARLRRGQSPFTGSPDHFALRLQDQAGWSRWRVLGVTAPLAVYWALAPALWRLLAPGWYCLYATLAAALAGLAWYACWRLPPHLADNRDPRRC